MTTYTIASGYDTYALLAAPTTNFDGSTLVGVGSGAAGYVYFPLPPDVIGATVASASLTGIAAAGFSAQTVVVKLVTSSWSAAAVTWNNQPSAGSSVSTVLALGHVGDQVILGSSALMQAVAAGADWLGFQLTGAGAISFNSFDSGLSSWVLTIVTTEAPEQPQSLVPNGTVVGAGAPVLTCDFTDNGGLSNDMAAMNVQVNATNVWTSPTYDQTGTTTVPVFDLSSPPPGATAFTAITTGSSRFWRVRVQDADGNWSPWSDGVQFTYRVQPSLTLVNPSSGVVYDPTFVVAATSGANMSAYRVQITDGSDRSSVRYDSGRLAANPGALTAVTVAIPEENGILGIGGTRILVDGSTYQLHIQTWDTFTNRQSTPGSPAYVESWTNFAFADDSGVTAPTTLATTQVTRGPGVTLTWTRGSAPDGWVILRKGPNDSTPKVIKRSDGLDVTIPTAGTYQWVDTHPQPWIPQVYTVKAITSVSGNPHQSQPSPTATITPQGLGVWLYTQDGRHVCLDGNTVDQLTVLDRRTTYKPVNVGYDVDIVTGYEGISGTFTGTYPSDIDPSQDLSDVQAILLAIRANPSQYVRMVYGTFSGRVLLRNVSILPSPLGSSATPLGQVTFGVNQVGDFDQVRA